MIFILWRTDSWMTRIVALLGVAIGYYQIYVVKYDDHDENIDKDKELEKDLDKELDVDENIELVIDKELDQSNERPLDQTNESSVDEVFETIKSTF